jgi:Glycosyl hydrolases family 16
MLTISFSAKSLCLSTAFFLFLTSFSSGQSNFPNDIMHKWQIEYLEGGIFVESDIPSKNFIDNFEGASLNTANWMMHYGNGVDCGSRTHQCWEEQVYKDENVAVSDGYLRLTAQKEQVTWSNQTRKYTSGMIHGRDHVQIYNYGRWSIRCNFPTYSNGEYAALWPAFWFWYHDEFDVFENFGNPDAFLSNVHFNTSKPELSDGSEIKADLRGFHTYEMEWTPFKITFFMDGNAIKTVYKYYLLNDTPLDVNPGQTIPSGYYKVNPVYIDTWTKDSNGNLIPKFFQPIINLAVLPNGPIQEPHLDCEGKQCAIPLTNWRAGTDYDVLLPATWLVDWVKLEENKYEIVNVTINDCNGLCVNDNFQVNLNSFIYNATLNPIIDYSPITDVSWNFGSNSIVIGEPYSLRRDLRYIGPYVNSNNITISVRFLFGGKPYTINKEFPTQLPPPTVIQHFTDNTCHTSKVYILSNGHCINDMAYIAKYGPQKIAPISILNKTNQIELTFNSSINEINLTYKDECNTSKEINKKFDYLNLNPPNITVTYKNCRETEVIIEKNDNAILGIDVGDLNYFIKYRSIDTLILSVNGAVGRIITYFPCGSVTTNLPSNSGITFPDIKSIQLVDCNRAKILVKKNGAAVTKYWVNGSDENFTVVSLGDEDELSVNTPSGRLNIL